MSSNLSEISNSFEDLAETSHNDENVATMSSLNLHDYEVESDSTESEQEPDTSEDEAPDHQDLLSDGDEEKSYSKDPLFPKFIYDIKGAVINFSKVFNARYGYNHAPFFAGSLEEAIEESFVAPGRPENDRKPLAIYLHSDDKAASASNVFPEKILCSEKVSSLLSKQYVTWPFDMTLEHHQEVFYELISNTVCAEIKDEIQQIPIANYPLLVIVVQEKYPAFACIFVQGHDTESEAVENLLVGLDHFAANKTRAKENLYETRERQSLLNVWLEAQRKQNYCNSKDEKDVATEIDIIKKALVPDVKYFSDYQRPDVTSAGSGDAEYQFSVPSSDSEPSVAEAHARFKKSNVTTFTLPEPTDVESFTDISKFTVDVSGYPLNFSNVCLFSMGADSCFAFEFSLLREKRISKNLKIVAGNLRDNEIDLLFEYCINGCSSEMVVFVNPLNSFAPVRRLINLFRCVPDISSASLFIHFELTEKAQEEVLQLIVQNKAGSSEDGKEFCILAPSKEGDRILKLSFTQISKISVSFKSFKITVE